MGTAHTQEQDTRRDQDTRGEHDKLRSRTHVGNMSCSGAGHTGEQDTLGSRTHAGTRTHAGNMTHSGAGHMWGIKHAREQDTWGEGHTREQDTCGEHDTLGELDTCGEVPALGSASDPQCPQLGSRAHWFDCDPPGRGCQQCQVCPSAPSALILTWAPVSPGRLGGSQTQPGVPHSGGGVGGDETLSFQVLGGCPGSRNLPKSTGGNHPLE